MCIMGLAISERCCRVLLNSQSLTPRRLYNDLAVFRWLLGL